MKFSDQIDIKIESFEKAGDCRHLMCTRMGEETPIVAEPEAVYKKLKSKFRNFDLCLYRYRENYYLLSALTKPLIDVMPDEIKEMLNININPSYALQMYVARAKNSRFSNSWWPLSNNTFEDESFIHKTICRILAYEMTRQKNIVSKKFIRFFGQVPGCISICKK